MSSKRARRRRSCEGKQRHTSREHAQRHARHLIYKGGHYVPYLCQFCHHWHVGRPSRKVQQRIEERKGVLG